MKRAEPRLRKARSGTILVSLCVMGFGCDVLGVRDLDHSTSSTSPRRPDARHPMDEMDAVDAGCPSTWETPELFVDHFDADCAMQNWQVERRETLLEPLIDDGLLRLDFHPSSEPGDDLVWWDRGTSAMVYRQVSGDFVALTQVRVFNPMAQPTHVEFQLSGLSARALPSTSENSVHTGLGFLNGASYGCEVEFENEADGPVFEGRFFSTTTDGVSRRCVYENPSETLHGVLAICRSGHRFHAYQWQEEASWQRVGFVSHEAMMGDVRVGVTLGAFHGTLQVVAEYDWIWIDRSWPNSTSDCEPEPFTERYATPIPPR